MSIAAVPISLASINAKKIACQCGQEHGSDLELMATQNIRAGKRTHEVAPMPRSEYVRRGSEKARHKFTKIRKKARYAGDTTEDILGAGDAIPFAFNHVTPWGGAAI